MNDPSGLEKRLDTLENVLFAKWRTARRIKLGRPIVDEQETPSSDPNPSESEGTT
jgi:hypothetical protein